jgi:DNA-binding LytR/AlgR family response regulator
MTQESILIKHLGISYAVRIRDIFYIESSNKKVIVHTESDTVEYPGQMSDYAAFPGFFRCHRSYIVNMEHVVRYDISSVMLSNKKVILMSRRRYAAFAAAHTELANAFIPSYR